MKPPYYVALVVAASAFMAGVPFSVSAAGSPAIVTVNGQDVPRAAFDARLEDSQGASSVLQQLVQAALLDQYAASTHIVVADSDIAAKEAIAKASITTGTWDDALKAQGLTEADVHGVLREEVILDDALASQVSIAPSDVSAYFEKNKTQFAPGATLADAQPRIEQTLRQQQEAPIIPGFMQKLQTSAKFVVNDPRYASAFPGATSAPSPSVDGPPLTVNGIAIDRAAFDAKLEAGTAARAMLQQIVQSVLLDQYAKSNGIVASDAEIARREANLVAAHPNGQWAALLAQHGMNEDDVSVLLRQGIIVDGALRSDVHVTPAQISRYFTAHFASFETGDQARARHILVADLATADKVELLLKHGGDFAALARQYSLDPGSKSKGGELGWFPRGVMVAVFNDYVFSARVGAISAPIKSAFGYHIIQVEQRKIGPKPTLAANQDKIRTLLTQQQEAPFIQPFLQGLWTKATIVSTDPRFANLTP